MQKDPPLHREKNFLPVREIVVFWHRLQNRAEIHSFIHPHSAVSRDRLPELILDFAPRWLAYHELELGFSA